MLHGHSEFLSGKPLTQFPQWGHLLPYSKFARRQEAMVEGGMADSNCLDRLMDGSLLLIERISLSCMMQPNRPLNCLAIVHNLPGDNVPRDIHDNLHLLSSIFFTELTLILYA